MKGIKNLLIVIIWSLDTFMDVKKSKEDDGVINFKDSYRFIDNITQMPGVIRAAKEVPLEALDLDSEEGAEIAKVVIEKTGCAKQEVKTIIALAIEQASLTANWIEGGLNLVDAIKALKPENTVNV